MTIEITNEPVTRFIETKLPWLKTIGNLYLSGKGARFSDDLPSILQRYSFKQE